MEVTKYIEFLQWCLHPTDSTPTCISGINWKGLLEFAKKQTIDGIYCQGMQRLGNIPNKPSKDDAIEWMVEYMRKVRRNAKVDESVVKLTQFMDKNSIDFFVFKGQTVASYYPHPESRTSGDVDFYVFKKDWERAKDLLSKRVKITNAHSFRHLEFNLGSVPFEMHYHTTVFASRKKQQYWDMVIESHCADILDHVEIKQVIVPTLPPTVNAVYLFIHIYHHFLKEGIALRQFVDWMMFLEAKHNEVVVSELTAILNRLGLMKAFKALGAVLIEVLGMDVAFFPYSLSDSDKRYVDKIMTIILRYGNFGQYGRIEQQGGWKHSMETGIRSVRHITRFFWLSPAENLLWLPRLIYRSLIKNALRTKHDS